MPWFSVVIITKNEEKNIGRCLNSVEGLTDDILVVDSYSDDRTEEICRAAGVRCLQKAFTNYSEQKNWANSQANYDFILSLDADEALSPELHKNIALLEEKKKRDYYWLNRLPNYCGKWIWHSGWHPDWKVRLWNRQKGKWNGEIIHEKVEMESGTWSGTLDGFLYHYTFGTEEEHLLQIEKFSKLRAESDFKKGKRASWLHIYFFPPLRFVRHYILKLGFLDGKMGFRICRRAAFASRLRNLHLQKLQKSAGQHGGS